MTGVVAAALVAHVPTLGRVENTPDYQQTLVQAERTMGAAIREALKPDVWVIVSTHWVSTFDWFATCQAKHEGLCVAQEAPNLIPGLPYSYRGDPEFGAALVDAWKEAGVAAVRRRRCQEAALLVDRSDIQEEIVRLETHVQHFLGLLDEGGEVGKKLDFLLQEMNREANTLLSKTSGLAGEALKITEAGLAMKAEIEKSREQVQNLE